MLTTTLSQVEWVGGPVPNLPGFPLKACGNDGLQIANNLGAASCGEIALNEIKKQIRPDPTDQLRVLIREITDRGMHNEDSD